MWKVALRRKQSTHLYNYVIMLLQEHLFSELCVLFFLNTLRYNFKTNKMCYFMGDSSMHFDKLMCALSHFSHVWFCATLWTIASQAPLSMGFSRQECWSGLPRPPPGDLPDPGIKPASLTSPALASGFYITGATWEALSHTHSPTKLNK